MSLINTLSGRSQIEEQLNSFTYDKASIDQKIENANKPLNETNQLRPLTGTLDFGSTQYVRTQKDPLLDNDVVNKKYADALALESGAIKNQIRGTNSVVICTPGNVDVLINNENKLKVDADSIDLSQRAQYVGNISVSGDTMLVPKIYVDSRDNVIIQDVDDLATELRGVDTTLQQLIETDSARITQLNGDYQNFKTVTVPGTYMKKVADSHLNMGQAFRVRNLPPTSEPYDAISYYESNLRYMPKTTTLDAIPKPEANVDLNGVKMVNSAALTLGDIGAPGVPNRTLTTVDWVESRGAIYRDQANTYSDGRLQSQYFQLDNKISLVDSKKAEYSRGIDQLGIPLLDYNMGRTALFNLRDGVQDRDSVNMQQLTALGKTSTDGLALKADKATTYTKTETDAELAKKYDYTNGVANNYNISELQTNKADKSTTYTKTETDSALASKLSLSGGTMTGILNTGGNRLVQSYNPVVNHDVVNKEHLDTQLALKTNTSTTTALTNRVVDVEGSSSLNATNIATVSQNLSANYYNKTNIDAQLNNKADKTTVTTLQSDLVSLSGSLSTTNNNLATNYNTKTQDIALYKPKDQIESKIEHASQLASISCDSNRYISIKSNGNKLCDILEDEVNQGFTLNTYSKRLNMVSEQPLTQYHNSTTGLFNFKFTGNSDTTTPLATNYGLLQIAPSQVTNLNPSINLISSRINGFGTAGALYLDSSYGNVEIPLVLSPQTISDINSTQMIQYRSTATPVLKNQFQGKAGYSTTTAITETNQFTSKTYVDTADALKVSKAGDTMSGTLTLSGAPTSSLHATTKAYVDSAVSNAGTGDFKSNGTVAMAANLNMGTTNKIINLADPTLAQDGSTKKYTDDQVATKISQTQGDARYLQLSGGTLSGALVLPSNPTSNLQAATKQYVDTAISSVGSGSGISTSGGYAVQTSLNDIQRRLNSSAYLTESTFFGILDQTYSSSINRRQYTMASQGSVNYTHAQYLVANGISRTLISLADIGSEGTQCARLSVYQRNSSNTGHENENYLQFKPLLNKIEVSVPISMITEPTYTGLNLVTKNYVDTAVGSISTSTQNKIQTTVDNNDRVTVQCNTGQVSVSKKNIVDQLQFTGNTISQVSGNSLQLQRGQVALTLTDDGTTQNIGSNFPVIYSTQPTSVTSQDHLVSQRITDGRYFKKTADSNLPMAGFKVTGLGDASSSGDAVHFGQMLSLMRSLGFRRSGSISLYVGDLPLSNNYTIPAGNITGDSGFGTISAVHRVTSNANYFEIRIVHNWTTNLIRLLTQIYSVGNTGLTAFNDNGFNQWVTNISFISTNEILFWLVYEANANDQSIQANGYTILLQEYV